VNFIVFELTAYFLLLNIINKNNLYYIYHFWEGWRDYGV